MGRVPGGAVRRRRRRLLVVVAVVVRGQVVSGAGEQRVRLTRGSAQAGVLQRRGVQVVVVRVGLVQVRLLAEQRVSGAYVGVVVDGVHVHRVQRARRWTAGRGRHRQTWVAAEADAWNVKDGLVVLNGKDLRCQLLREVLVVHGVGGGDAPVWFVLW